MITMVSVVLETANSVREELRLHLKPSKSYQIISEQVKQQK